MSTIAEFPSATQNADVFAAWAEVYDRQPNPLLALEERYLTCLLPRIQGKDVVDIGCGTGRWLQRLAAGRPSSLRGIDSSPEMLQVAAGKGFQSTQLTQAKLPVLPIEADSVDIALCSFVLSYVQDLALCASELARVIHHGGDLLLSDMHPSTAASLGWKRGFGAAGLTHLVQTNQRTIEELLDTFSANGFELAACLEPPFGKTEREIFEMNGKQAAWEQAAGLPAIYILHLRRMRQARTTSHSVRLHSAYCALGPNELMAASVSIDERKVCLILSAEESLRSYRAVDDSSIDLSGYLLFPGLINAHDHLEFALFPRLGTPPYGNATQWAADIQANESETIARHKRISKDVRLWWGGVRNLLCGATTVCHHNPLDPVLQGEDYPVHVVAHYGWEHSVAFAKDVVGALQSTDTDEPFLIHACEGIDEEASQEIRALDALHAIEQRSVLIHGLALNRTGIALLNEHGASLVVCPSSNQFLFAKTHTRERLLSVERLALGSDSPLTATGDLLDELRFAKSACDLHAEELYPLVTRQAADVLRLRRGEGALRPDSVADFVAVRHRPGTPAEILAELNWRDVQLVIVGGRVHLASVNIMDRLPEEMKHDLTPLMVEGELRWLRGPVNTMLQDAERVLGKDNVRLGGLQISAV